MSRRQHKKQIDGTLQLFIREQQRLNRMNQQNQSQIGNFYVKYNTQNLSKVDKDTPQKKMASLKTEEKNLTNNSIELITKSKNLYLPQLAHRQNKSIQPKYLINDFIYFDCRSPQVKSGSKKKKYSLQKEYNEKIKQQKDEISNEISKSSRKKSQFQMVQIHLKQYEKSHVQLQTNSRSKKTLSLSQRQKIKANTPNKHVSQFKLPVQDESVAQEKSRIEKILQNFKLKKQGSNIPTPQQRSNLIESIHQLQRIKIIGQQTSYFHKMVVQQPFKQKPSLSKSKIFNWKAKEMPFKQLSHLQVKKLLLMYLFIDEVTPSTGYYKAYVGEGNNAQLITRLIKNRSSWTITDDISEANFIWTQLPHDGQMKKLKPQAQIKLQISGQKQFVPYQIEKKQNKQIQQFIRFKSNHYFNGCSKIMHPNIYRQFILEFVCKFKQNAYLKHFVYIKEQVLKYYNKLDFLKRVESKKMKIINHCENSEQIGDKKLLFFHIGNYCEINNISKQTIIPKTIHLNLDCLSQLKNSQNIQIVLNKQLESFELQEQLLILKPGEQSNRGKGITVHPNKQSLIDHLSKSLSLFPENKTYVVQQYIDPLLYDRRKFDIRVWVLYSNNRVWFYRQGYIRTSCKEFTTKNMNKYIHLTNDAIQKYSDQYGKYQPANKLSFQDLDKYLKKQYNYDKFYTEIYSNIKTLTKTLFQVGNLMIGKSTQQFQLFGLDFLMDKNFKLWLIQCNTNPSIQICCSLLSRLVPNMLQNLLSVVLDPLFPPGQRKSTQDKDWNSQKFHFQLLYDGTLETNYLQRVMRDNKPYLSVLRGINEFKLDKIGEIQEGYLNTQQNQIYQIE